MKQSAAGPQAPVVARTTQGELEALDVHCPLLVFTSLAALVTAEEAGWRAIHVRRCVRMKNSDVKRPLLASKSLLLAHRHGRQEQCWQIGWRTLHRSTIGGRVQRVHRGTPQSGAHKRDRVARYVARWETLHESKP